MDTLKKFSAFLLLSFLILPGIAGASGQDSINELIKKGGNVSLSGTYTLTGPITLSSDLNLNGQNSTIITIPDNADWSVWVPLMTGTGLHNVTIEGIEFNANADGNDETPHGRGYYNCIHLMDCRNVNIRNCLFHDGKGDGLRAKYCANVKFYNNIAYKLGHDCFYAIDSESVFAWNNTLTTRTNSGLRLWNTKDANFFCNRINSQLDSLGGNAGIQIEDSKGTMGNVRVFANTIHETWGPGVWLISYGTGSDNYQNITVDHNRIIKDGISYNIDYTSGITINGVQGTKISNNIFDGCNNAGILVLDGGKNTDIEKNIITNICGHPAISQSGTGYGIDNRINAEIYILNNCFFNNINGDVFRAESVGDDLQNPTMHNTSSGWEWDGTGWSCDYVTAIENYTIGNSTLDEMFENGTCGNVTNNTGSSDKDLHEVILTPVSYTCPLKNVTGCNKAKFKCPSIYDVPLIASITGCCNKTKSTSCPFVKQSCVNGSCAPICGDLQLKLKIIDNSQSGGSTSDAGGTSNPDEADKTPNTGMGGSSGPDEIFTPTSRTVLPVPGFTTDPANGTLTTSAQINVNRVFTPAVADFKAAPINSPAALRVNFTDKSRYTTMPGSAGGSTKQVSVTVNEVPATVNEVPATNNEVPVTLSANFNASRSNGVVPLSVTFTDSSTGAATYAWDFGDHAGTSAAQNPSYLFTRAGSYDVVLTVSDGKGHSAVKHMPITVTSAPLVADFDANRTGGVDPMSVQFTDKSIGAATWEWNFGDNSQIVTTRNAEHTFGVGSWTVNLKVSDGTNSASRTMILTVAEKPIKLTADFTVDRTSGQAPCDVQFTDASEGGAAIWSWDFGDGNQSIERNPKHTFTTPGSYGVTLTVSDSKGHSAVKRMPITVTSASLVADFDADRTGGVDPMSVRFTDKSIGAATWEWNFGDNSQIVTTRNAKHTFGVGSWTVNLKVSDGTNSVSKTMTITVAEKPAAPIANFITDRTAGDFPLAVQFFDQSKNAVLYEWDFGDGNTSTEKSPGHIYTAEGNYAVTLTVTGSNGEKSTSQAIITVTSKRHPSDAAITDVDETSATGNATPFKSLNSGMGSKPG